MIWLFHKLALRHIQTTHSPSLFHGSGPDHPV